MSIDERLEKIKPFYVPLLLIVVATIFFALGRLYTIKEQDQPIKIEYKTLENTASVVNAGIVATSTTKTPTTSPKIPNSQTTPTTQNDAEVIGSKSGKKYYFPWCGTVKRIKPENQVHFASIEAARAAGFLPGGNCKGLK